MTVDKEWIFTELKKAALGLTTTTIEDLLAVFGEDSLDELALDFNNFYRAAIPFLQETDQLGLSLLSDIDEHLDKISGRINAEMWTHKSFLHHGEWASIRKKAVTASQHFSWN